MACGAAIVLLATCNRVEERARADSAAGAASATAAAAVPSLPECPNTTGRWDECNVRQRLERAGLAPQPLGDTLRQPLFSVPGIGYRVGRGELQVYLYESATALAKDLAELDTVRVQRGASAVSWSATPTLITSNNMAAVLLSEDGTQVERVRLALTAGLPAPTKGK